MDRFLRENSLVSNATWGVVLGILMLYFINWNKRRKYYAHFSKIPGPPTWFLFGNLQRFIKIYWNKNHLPSAVYLLEMYNANRIVYGGKGMYVFWFSSTPSVVILKAEIMEVVLSSSTSLDKSWEYRFLHSWLGFGLLTSTGKTWRTRRRILTPSFHFRILEDFVPVFNEQSMILIQKLRSLEKAEYININPLVTLCTLDIISETVMGVHIGAQNDSESEYVQAIHELGDFFNRRVIRPWFWSDIMLSWFKEGRKYMKYIDVLHSFTRKIIKEKKRILLCNQTSHKEETAEEENIYLSRKKRKAFLDMLLDLHIRDHLLSEEDIREEVDTFMFEGHDTTATAINWALYCIGLYPQVQRNIVEELWTIFGDDQQRPITTGDIRQMKYLECVLKESQRIFPAVPMIGRKLSEDVSINGVTIPKGTELHLSLIWLHASEKEFPNPEVFDPERFLPDNVAKRHPYSFIPFSAGPRNCIGQKFAMMEVKVVISNILRNFEITSLDPRDKVHRKVEFVLRPAQPLRLKFKSRNSENMS